MFGSRPFKTNIANKVCFQVMKLRTCTLSIITPFKFERSSTKPAIIGLCGIRIIEGDHLCFCPCSASPAFFLQLVDPWPVGMVSINNLRNSMIVTTKDKTTSKVQIREINATITDEDIEERRNLPHDKCVAVLIVR